MAVNWEMLKHERCIDGLSLAQLSKKYGVARSTISMRAKREGWTEIEQVIEQAIAEKSTVYAELTKKNIEHVEQFGRFGADFIDIRARAVAREESKSLEMLEKLRELQEKKLESEIEEQGGIVDAFDIAQHAAILAQNVKTLRAISPANSTLDQPINITPEQSAEGMTRAELIEQCKERGLPTKIFDE